MNGDKWCQEMVYGTVHTSTFCGAVEPSRQAKPRHLMMQTTLFIGPVDFYWTDRSSEHLAHLAGKSGGKSSMNGEFFSHVRVAEGPSTTKSTLLLYFVFRFQFLSFIGTHSDPVLSSII